MGFVDLHSHVLFGLDDGAPDATTSMQMIEALAAIGFTEICATPHQLAAKFLPDLGDIARTFDALTQAVGARARLHLAAENMWDDVFFGRSQDGTIPSYGGGPAFLFEIHPSAERIPLGLTEHIFRLTLAGKLPVMAHPERYEALWDDEVLTRKLHASCAFVVDLGAVAGYHGRKQGKVARRLLEDGLAHAVASDAHTREDVARAAEGIAWIRKRLGPAAVTRLLDDGPRQILAGELPES
jgi:protein-tyrosine phosphatase